MLPISFSKRAKEVAEVLSKIPANVWNEILKGEPEAKLGDQLERYGFGKFATFMVVAGLNDYQLTGPAEKVYWPKLHEVLRRNPVPDTPADLARILRPFYERERFKKRKLVRLEKFLTSELASRIWNSSPKEVSSQFHDIWIQLADVMNQKKHAKTIVFAMKTLGIALILAGESNFDFSRIPIPVDIRVRRITFRLEGHELNDKLIREFWSEVLRKIRSTNPSVTMIHLDSLVWQIGNMKTCSEIQAYFREFSIPHVGEEFCKLVGDFFS